MKITEADRKIIMKHFKENYDCICEVCGDNSEEAKDEKELYEKICSHPLKECQDEIEAFYAEMHGMVEGEIHKSYGSDPELIRMIERFINNKGVVKHDIPTTEPSH